MNRGVFTAAVFTAAFFTWPAAAVQAEPIETTLAVTVNPLSGPHETGHNQSDLSLLFGLRYINFTSRYSEHPGMLADRNVGWRRSSATGYACSAGSNATIASRHARGIATDVPAA